MINFEQYKIETFDQEMFSEEYKEEKYLWLKDFKDFPCDKFFIINGLKFNSPELIVNRKEIESQPKNYSSSMEYVAILPTDVYVIFDFYLSKLNESYDIKSIISYKELEEFGRLKKDKKKHILLNKKKIFNRNGYFALFVDPITRERFFEIIYVNNEKTCDDYLNSKKIQGQQLKLIVSYHEMDRFYYEYQRYKNNKIKKNEREHIDSLFKNNPMIGQVAPKNLIKFIDEELLRQLNLKHNNSIEEEEKAELKFLMAKHGVLLNYKRLFENYSQKVQEKNILEDEGVDIETMLDDITLYRHSENYFKTLLNKSHAACKKDKKLVDDEFIFVVDRLKELRQNMGVED